MAVCGTQRCAEVRGTAIPGNDVKSAVIVNKLYNNLYMHTLD